MQNTTVDFTELGTVLKEVQTICRLRHLSIRTEQAYTHWVRQFILFNSSTPLAETGTQQVRLYLSHLAQRGVAASTQNQALNGLVFIIPSGAET